MEPTHRTALHAGLPGFERLTRVARRALGVRVAGFSVFRDGGFWIESISGWDVDELPADRSLCAAVVATRQRVVLGNLLAEPGFRDHPLVLKRPHFRFYAGHPIQNATGRLVGSFFLYDTEPRDFGPDDLQLFDDFAALLQREYSHLEAELQAERVQQRLLGKLSTARNEALVDALTGVWNRRAGFDLLDKACSPTDDDSHCHAVCMIDLDCFKGINDTYGHPVGDEVLRTVATILVNSVRADDIVARYGGDEFLVVMKLPDSGRLQTAIQRIAQNLTNVPVPTRKGELVVSASVGGILLDRERSPYELLVAADDALLRSKGAARRGDGPAVARAPADRITTAEVSLGGFWPHSTPGATH